MRPPLAVTADQGVPESTTAVAQRVHTQSKSRTKKGEGPRKLIAALTKHHQYADGSCLNVEPIGNNKLARLAGVAPPTASKFFDDEFQGHDKYQAYCLNMSGLIAVLKLLNNEYAPFFLYSSKPPEKEEDEDDKDDE